MTTSRRSHTIARYTYVALLLGVGIGFLGGCNLFGTGSTNNGDTVEELVADADAAISKGNYDSAVASLEEAYEKEPENPEVRIKLSTALYGQADLNVVDLKRLVDYVSGLEEDQATTDRLAPAKNGLQCNIEAAEPNPSDQGYEEIDLGQNTVFSVFLNNRSLIDRVGNDILQQGFNDTEAFTNLPADLRSSWLTIAAFSEISTAILTVHSEAQERGGRLFRDSNDNVVFCAPEETDLEALECEAYRVAEQEDYIGEESLLSTALSYLVLKNEQFGVSGEDGLIPEALNELIDAVQENIDQEDRESCARSESGAIALR